MANTNSRVRKTIIAGAIGCLLISSCTFFRSFTTYFNVLYLAQKHLEQYEEIIKTEPTTQNGAVNAAFTHHWLEEELISYKIRRKRGTPIVPFVLMSKPKTSIIKGAASTHLDSAVILGSKVLAEKKPNKYEEDALFVVGKALYYKQNYEGAKRKFYELLYKYPKTEYAEETAMLLAESQVQTGQIDSATISLRQMLSSESSGRTLFRSDVHKSFADLLVSSSYDNYLEAAKELQLAEEGITGEPYAQLEYDRGRLFFLMEQWPQAEQAFRNALAAAADNTFQGEIMTGLAETLRHEEKYEEARSTFSSVISKTRYASSQPAAQYELAYTIELEEKKAANDNFRSQEFLTTILPTIRAAYYVVDTTYRNISQAIMVRSRFRQAEMFREIGKYDSASTLANIIIGTKDLSTPEMNDYVNERMRALTRYADNKFQLTKLDTIERILHKVRRPGNTIMETMLRELRQDAIKEFKGAKWNPAENYKFTPEEEKKIDEIIERMKKQKASTGISVFSINMTDTLRYVDSIRAAGAKAHFELGRAYDDLGEPENAISEYERALKYHYERPDTAINGLQAQILYSWIQLDNELKRYDERDTLLAELTHNFGTTKFAQQAMVDYAGKSEKKSPGETAFRAAMASLPSSGIEISKQGLLGVIATYPNEDVAPRALYAIGLAYEDAHKNDSALYYYSRLVKEYPFSKYTDEIKPRITFALMEYERRKTAPPAKKIQEPPKDPNKK